MRVVPGRVEPVGKGKAQVVTIEFDQGRLEFLCKVHALRKGISLKLKMPTKHGHAEGQKLKKIKDKEPKLMVRMRNILKQLV